ncbi:MAG TPA: hypothetical protein VEK39_07015 [Solirubrobacterales bacterium]|nr:hypothetical protein [Solirubrobacterales bacterium]
MSKPTITRLFVAALVAVAAGLVLVLAAVWAAFASDLLVTVTLVVVGSLAMLAGAVAAVVSWIGALLNTAQLEDKTWFVSLLVLGLLGVGVLAMVAYVLAGPDGTSRGVAPAGIAPAPTQQETEMQ